MKGTIGMEIRDVQRIGGPDEAVDAIIRLAEAVEVIHDKVVRLEEYHAQEQVRFQKLVVRLEQNTQRREKQEAKA